MRPRMPPSIEKLMQFSLLSTSDTSTVGLAFILYATTIAARPSCRAGPTIEKSYSTRCCGNSIESGCVSLSCCSGAVQLS